MTGPERPRGLPPEPARRAAYDVLAAVRTTDAYANLVLPRLLRQQRINGRDAAFATELAYGTLRTQGTLDAILARCVDRPLASLDGGVLDLLRLGGYQLLRTRVGPHAAVSATVDLARIVTTDGPAKLVNAVLRRVSEHDYASWLDLTAPVDDPIGALAVRHAHPRWVAQAFCDALGWPLAGTNRCRLHGGSFPQAQARARERIIAATDVAAGRLIEFMNDKKVPWAIRLAAARDLLDRGGVTAKTVVEVEAPWQELIEGIVAEVGDALPDAVSRRGEDDDLDLIDAEVVAAAEDYAPSLSSRPTCNRRATGYGCRSAYATARPGRRRCVAVRPTVRARSVVRVTLCSRRLPFGVASRPKMS